MKRILSILLLSATILNIKGEESHVLPLLCSLVFPGGGQLYNQKFYKATFYVALEGALLYGAYIQDYRYQKAQDRLTFYDGLTSDLQYRKLQHEVNFYGKERKNFLWLSVAGVLLSAGDAFVDSYFKSFKHEEFNKWQVQAGLQSITLVYNF